jgi:hypothetical protein
LRELGPSAAREIIRAVTGLISHPAADAEPHGVDDGHGAGAEKARTGRTGSGGSVRQF